MTIDQGAMGAIARSILNSDVIENDNNVLQKFNRHKF